MANLPPPPNGYTRPNYLPSSVVGIPEVLVPAPPYTVLLAKNACESTRANQDHTFATEVFMDNFVSYKDTSNEDIEDSFKTFSSMTTTQGHISLMLAQHNNIKAFTQWVKDQFRLEIDPTRLPFPQYDTEELLRRAKTHQLIVSKSDTTSKSAKKVILTKQGKWDDCAPTLMNYVREISGRDGVPLKYIIRDNGFANLTPNKDFLDDYVNNASLQG